jgi:hypothetical protein
MISSRALAVAGGLVCALLAGCGRDQPTPPAGNPSPPGAAAAPALQPQQIAANPERLHALLRARNPYYQGEGRFQLDPALGLVGELVECAVVDLSPLRGIAFAALDLRATPVSDLSPLAGMPLKLLALENTRVTNLAPLAGLKLEKLYLNQTSVRDLRPLAGMPLVELMLVGAPVEDLEPLRGTPLTGLWLNQTPVTSIAALAACPLLTLTLEDTRVADLRPLAGMATLRRLHVGGTPVRDLAPLADLRLTRLVFTPVNVTNGLEVVRQMATLEELGTSLEDLRPPAEFWRELDAGGGVR